MSRELVDQAWLDVGLGRTAYRPPDDADTPSSASERDEVGAAWQTLAALDRTRRM